MAARKNAAADKAATTKAEETQPAVDNAAPAELNAQQDTPNPVVEPEAVVDPEAVVEPEAVVQNAIETESEIAFPARLCVTNNTRMPVQVPAVGLELVANGSAEIVCLGEREYCALKNDLAALAEMNGFAADAFVVEVIGEVAE